MKAQELREAWTRFWVDRAHTDVASAGLIPLHPSAPMFTNSGMMPFVPYFIGEEQVPYRPPRASSIQRCVRLGGKHNDLDDIGRSTRHLSFFEMLGHFSFGDYFKADAIGWAWEFCTEVLGLDADRIWVTCHVDDDEAAALWIDEVGFPAQRFQRLGKDNFWEMGELGPCGPSSELFWDFGPEHGPGGGPANPVAENRYVEFWNAVFQQYFRQPDGSLEPLRTRNIDTGAGLERILTVVNGVPDVFATDELRELVGAAESATGTRLGAAEESDIALKLLADHARTMTFLINDGVIPSNEERGYVLRRIIRRAVRFAYLLDVDQPITPLLAARTIDLMGDANPEIRSNAEVIGGVLEREEAQFRKTLRSGLSILDAELVGLSDEEPLPGHVAFTLHDTYGFPLEVTTEIVEGRGRGVDQAGFDAAMADQRQRARASTRKGTVPTGETADAFQAVLDAHGTTDFVGREELTTKATVLAVVTDPSDETTVILDRTPFYAESGGQVGDTGTIDGLAGQVMVADTRFVLPGLHGHVLAGAGVGGDREGTPAPQVGDEVTAVVDVERRAAIRRNHTGTHLLHWALRQVLGEHVKQQGSYVDDERLRFDFSHFEAVTPQEITAIEDLVNHDVLDNAPVRHFETTKTEAMALGAIAFFGDKYGDVVRVLEAGPHSTELCGGTHVRRTGDIGPVKIVSESSIGANLRRIEAVTGTGPIDRLRSRETELATVAERVGVPQTELLDGVDKRLGELADLRAEVKTLRAKLASGGAADLAAQAVDGIVVTRVDGPARDDLRSLAVAVRDQPDVRAVVLIGAPEGGGVALVAAVAKEIDLNAGELIAAAARTVGGGGGKNPDLAVAGGKDPSGIDDALDQARRAAGIV